MVEDTLAIGEIIEYALNDIPAYQATTVANGADALAFVAECRVDLILLDINLPRGRATTASVPILFMAAGEHRQELARRGVAAWLRKPFDIDDLLARVAAVLSAHGQMPGNGVGDGATLGTEQRHDQGEQVVEIERLG